MTFRERIQSHLLTHDKLLQDFILHAIHDYPTCEKEWITKLLEEAIKNEEKASVILLYLPVKVLDEDIVELLIRGVKTASEHTRQLYLPLFLEIEPSLALTYRTELEPYIPYWELYISLESGTKEDLWSLYRDIIKVLNNKNEIDVDLYKIAKKIAFTLVKKGLVTEERLKSSLAFKNFTYDCLLAVYMIGLMRLETFSTVLASMLVSEDDLFLEEVAASLIAINSDRVVKAVTPYILREQSSIHAVSVIENIKSSLAVEVLRKSYRDTDNIDIQAIIFEALIYQLSPIAKPEIKDFLTKQTSSYLVDADFLSYCYHKIID